MKMFKLVDIENIFAQPYPLGIQKYIIEKFNKNFWKSVSVADINKYTSMQLKKIKICLCILSWNSLGL